MMYSQHPYPTAQGNTSYPYSQQPYSTAQDNTIYPYSQAGPSASGSQHFQRVGRSGNRIIHQHVEGDISSEDIRQYQEEINAENLRQYQDEIGARRPNVRFRDVVIEGEGEDGMGSPIMGNQFDLRPSVGVELNGVVDREVLNAIVETGTDEKGRRALKERYAKMSPEGRRQRELRLAQYAGFEMRVDGSLDYGLSDTDTVKKTNFIKVLLRRLSLRGRDNTQ